MTSKPDALSTLGYHWKDYIGTTLADSIALLSSSGNPVSICINGTHWKPLEPQEHWDATETTLADGSLQWYPSGNPHLRDLNWIRNNPLKP